MLRFVQSVAITVIALLIHTASGFADTLTLQNGRTVAGEVYAGTETAWIHSGVPNNVVGLNNIVRAGYQDGGAQQFRTLIRFGELSHYAGVTSDLLGFTPDQITGATLTLYKRGNSEGAGTVELHVLDTIDQGWSEGWTTWNHRRTDTNEGWSQGSGIGNAFGPLIGTAQPFNSTQTQGTPVTFDLTSSPQAMTVLKNWVSGLNTSGTFLLKSTAETGVGNAYTSWYSENQNAGNELLMPMLQITYDLSLDPPVEHTPDYGKQWIRERPFTISAWGASAADPLYQNANFSALLAQSPTAAATAARNGMISHALPLDLRGVPLTNELKAQLSNHILSAGDDHALMITDEPEIEHFADLGDIAAWVRQTYPATLVYVNALPVGSVDDPDAYVDQLVATIQPDVLMHDQYPVMPGGLDRNQHFANVTHYRNKGIEHDLPNFAYIQSFQFAPEHGDNRLPSESQLRTMLFSYLAAGYKGFAYFKFGNTSTALSMALLDPDSNPGPLYAPAAAANAEVLELGNALRFLESTDLRFIPGSTSPQAPTGLADWAPSAGSDPHILDISVGSATPNQGAGKDGLIGFFSEDGGDQYFMLTNLYEGNELSSAAASLEFVLSFTEGIDAIYRLNRLNGVPERVDLSQGILELTLPGGTGDLFKYDNGYFPGILPGDSDLDGDVDLSDLSTLAAHYGNTGTVAWSDGDFDLDGDIDLADLSTLAAYYGNGVAQAYADFTAYAAVPEPAALALVFLSLSAVRIRNNRQL